MNYLRILLYINQERKALYFFFFLELIRVYDGNATFRNSTPRSISVPKQATYTQILVCISYNFLSLKIKTYIFQEAALRTFHINDDSTKYCITVPTDDGMKIIK